MKTVTKIDRARIQDAKFAYSTARIDRSSIRTLLQGQWKPRAGDLLLARIVDLEQDKQLDLPSGRKSHLFVGEEVVVCYGNTYVPEQFEAVVPHSLEVCSLVASGGIAAKMLSFHDQMRMPTSIQPIGLLGNSDGQRINLAQFSLAQTAPERQKRPFTLAVVGSGMNAGQTTASAHLVRGLNRSGLTVGAAKITGAGSGQYVWHMLDAGARQAIDFTHAGLPSTYMVSEDEVQRVFSTLTGELSRYGIDVIVLDIADGLYQKETSALLKSQLIRESVDSIIFTAADAMGAVAGVHWLQEKSLPVVAISGSLTDSPLALREAQCITELPVLDREGLTSTNWKFLLENSHQADDRSTEFRISIDRLNAIMAMPVSLVC